MRSDSLPRISREIQLCHPDPRSPMAAATRGFALSTVSSAAMAMSLGVRERMPAGGFNNVQQGRHEFGREDFQIAQMALRQVLRMKPTGT